MSRIVDRRRAQRPLVDVRAAVDHAAEDLADALRGVRWTARAGRRPGSRAAAGRFRRRLVEEACRGLGASMATIGGHRPIARNPHRLSQGDAAVSSEVQTSGCKRVCQTGLTESANRMMARMASRPRTTAIATKWMSQRRVVRGVSASAAAGTREPIGRRPGSRTTAATGRAEAACASGRRPARRRPGRGARSGRAVGAVVASSRRRSSSSSSGGGGRKARAARPRRRGSRGPRPGRSSARGRPAARGRSGSGRPGPWPSACGRSPRTRPARRGRPARAARGRPSAA